MGHSPARADLAMLDFKDTVLPPSASIRDAIQAIERTPAKIALVVNAEGRLCGTITDGDVRRGILRGLPLDGSVTEVMNAEPKVAPAGSEHAVLLAAMRRDQIRHIPLVDEKYRLVNLIIQSELEPFQPLKNWVVIMAGGEGRRLRPFTESLPKPMLTVGQKPILEHIVGDLAAQGFQNLFVSVNYLADVIDQHFGNGSRFGVNISYLRETAPLGTCGSLSLLVARPAAPFIVINGDVMVNIDFRRVLEFHQDHGAAATVCVREESYNVPYGVVAVDGERLIEITEKPSFRHLVNAGIYIFSPKVLDYMPDGRRVDTPELIGRLIGAGERVCAFPVHEYWFDVGRPSDLHRVRSDFEAKDERQR